MERDRAGCADRDEPAVAVARAEWFTHVDLADIARVVGRLIPGWLSETISVANAEQTLSIGDRTFTTVTDRRCRRCSRARSSSACRATTRPGSPRWQWTPPPKSTASVPRTATPPYLMCRPARPAPPIELEQRITGGRLLTDLELAGKDLIDCAPSRATSTAPTPKAMSTPRRFRPSPGSCTRPPTTPRRRRAPDATAAPTSDLQPPRQAGLRDPETSGDLGDRLPQGTL